MRFEITFNEDQNRFILKTFEYLTMQGIEEMVKELLTHNKWQKGRDLLIDHREASFAKISIEDIISLSNTVMVLDKTLGSRRCSAISPEDGYLKNSMYESKIESKVDTVTKTFLPSQYKEAIEWLDNDR